MDDQRGAAAVRASWNNFGIILLAAAHLGCAKPLCKELLAPQWGGEGTLSPKQVVLFHGCYDGDTCTFTFPTLPAVFGSRLSVRLVGIDTPEMHGHCDRERALARQAHQLTESLLTRARQIEITDLSRDKYFRLDARVMADGQDISQALLTAHLAVAYNGGTKTVRWCESY